MSSSLDTQPALYRLGSRIYRTIQLLVTTALVFALIYGWQWLSNPAEFPIKSVKMDAPCVHVDQQTLRARILPYVSQGFIRLDIRALKEQLLELPWIAAVKIERIWPDTVKIHITEQEAVSRWGKRGVLNTEGHIFSPDEKTIPADLPLLNGPYDQATSLWTTYKTCAEMLAPLGLQVHALDMDERLSLQLELRNGTHLFLGKSNALSRMQRFARVYPKIFTVPDAQAEYVDLRYENGVSVKWRSTKNQSGATG